MLCRIGNTAEHNTKRSDPAPKETISRHEIGRFDNGPQYTSGEFQQFARDNGFKGQRPDVVHRKASIYLEFCIHVFKVIKIKDL